MRADRQVHSDENQLKATHQAQNTSESGSFDVADNAGEKLMAGSNMTRQTRQAAVVQLQRTHGNAFVQRMLNGQSANTPQRLDDFGMESFDWSNTGENTADNTGALNPDMPSGQSESIGGGGSSVSAGGAGVNISGPSVSINSPMTQADGVIRASTIIADSVIASTYSPGTGNMW